MPRPDIEGIAERWAFNETKMRFVEADAEQACLDIPALLDYVRELEAALADSMQLGMQMSWDGLYPFSDEDDARWDELKRMVIAAGYGDIFMATPAPERPSG